MRRNDYRSQKDVRMRKVVKYIHEEDMRRSSRKEFKRNNVGNRTNNKIWREEYSRGVEMNNIDCRRRKEKV